MLSHFHAFSFSSSQQAQACDIMFAKVSDFTDFPASVSHFVYIHCMCVCFEQANSFGFLCGHD